MIGLTAARGEAKMAILIFAADELSFEKRTGHNIGGEYDEIKV